MLIIKAIFMNLNKGSITVREYYMKFVKLSKYATSLVSNNRDDMSRFLSGISNNLEEECREALFLYSMDLSMLMFHSKWRNVGRGITIF